jgi:hypothetical protein
MSEKYVGKKLNILGLEFKRCICSLYKHRQNGAESQQKKSEASEKMGETAGIEDEAFVKKKSHRILL